MRGPFPEMRIIFTEEFRRQVINPGFIFVTAVILVPTVAIVVMIAAGVQVGDSISVSFKGCLDDEVSESWRGPGTLTRRAPCPALDCRTRRNATTTAPRVLRRSGKVRLTPSSY